MLRSMLEVTMFFFVIVVFSQPLLVLANMAVGAALAALVAYFRIPEFASLNHSILLSVHLQVMIYTLIGGLIFSRSNLKGQLAQEKLDTLMQMTNCIAYEMKNPLAQILHRFDLIKQRMPLPGSGDKPYVMSGPDLEFIYRELIKIRPAVQRGIQTADMAMDETGFTQIDPDQFRVMRAGAITRTAVDDYGYQNVGERAAVSVHVLDDFVFQVDDKRYTYVLYNLLKNAIYYFKSHPEARVKVIVDDHRVIVEDTGPGIEPEVMERLFHRFHNVDKPGATGLGLAFCKKTMEAFGGHITCESRPDEPTRFVLSFPRMSKQQHEAYDDSVKERARNMFSNGSVLIVDDGLRFREFVRESLAPYVKHLDEAEDGQAALDMLARKRYDAVVLDLSMPVMDGYETAESIRRGCVPGQEHMTILVRSSESPQRARALLDRIGVDAFLSKEGTRMELVDGLCHAHEAATHRQKTLQVVSTLAEKTLLLADEEGFSRKYIRGALQERGMRVIDVMDGASLMDKLTSEARIDVVLLDMRVPALDGIEITRAIRALPFPLCATPVIAMAAHCGPTLLSAARDAGVDEHLSKPTNLMDLFQKLNKLLTVDDSRPQDEVWPEPAPEGPAAGGDSAVIAPPLLDMVLFARLRHIGMTPEDLSEGVNKIRTKLDQLEASIAASDLNRVEEALQLVQIMGGQIGARAFLEEARAQHVFAVKHQQVPPGDWLPVLRERLEETARAIEANMQGPSSREL